MHKLKDNFGRIWNLEEDEICPECGQPDNVGDCNHQKISAIQYKQLKERKNYEKNMG